MEHRELYEAIASGDPERARAEALAHVRTNYRSTVRHLFGEPEGAEEAGGSGRSRGSEESGES